MNEREKTIRLWFDMWLNQQDMGIDDIFTEDVIYTESWSPQYNNRIPVARWLFGKSSNFSIREIKRL